MWTEATVKIRVPSEGSESGMKQLRTSEHRAVFLKEH